MDHVSGSAIAALTGSAIGGLTPILSAYLIQRGLTERETISRELAERQTLYSNFIDYAMKVYGKEAGEQTFAYGQQTCRRNARYGEAIKTSRTRSGSLQ